MFIIKLKVVKVTYFLYNINDFKTYFKRDSCLIMSISNLNFIYFKFNINAIF